MHLIIKLIANGWNKCEWSKLGRFPFQFDVFDYYVTHFIFQSVIFSQIVFIFIWMWFLLSTATDHSKSVKPFRIIFFTSFDLLLPVMPLLFFSVCFSFCMELFFFAFPFSWRFTSTRAKLNRMFSFSHIPTANTLVKNMRFHGSCVQKRKKKLKKKLVKKKRGAKKKKFANKIIWEIKPQSHWANVFYMKHTEVWHNANGLCT